MSYIDGNLLQGEHVVFRTHLHWKLLIAPIVFLLAMCVPLGWLYVQGTWNNWILIAPAIGLLVLLAAIIKRQSSDFAVTNKRVMMKVGVFSTRSVELLLGKIEAIAVNQTLGGRMFGYGDIVVTGSGGTAETFANIQAPLAFRRAVQSVTDASAGGAEAVPATRSQ
ncbi:MAG TPA: PH domain-containing protein [Casimicrobiaceae bacterium]|nr:PH domain-containing protein [Casimicrobiaceae bacterium]